MILIDYREGSKSLALYEPLRSILQPCAPCNGTGQLRLSSSMSIPCDACYSTGRILSSLTSADVSILGNGPDGPTLVGVEVKTISDLISSLQSKRLQDIQIPRMIDDYEVRWILLIGRYRANPRDRETLQVYKCFHGKVGDDKVCDDCGQIVDRTEDQQSRNQWKRNGWFDYTFSGSKPVPYGYVESFISGVSLTSLGFQSRAVETYPDAANWLTCLHRQWTKKFSAHKSLQQSTGTPMKLKPAHMSTNPKDPNRAYRIDHAMCLPNIGYDRACLIADSFTSVREMINAAEKDLVKIKGIGPVLAQAAVKSVT